MEARLQQDGLGIEGDGRRQEGAPGEAVRLTSVLPSAKAWSIVFTARSTRRYLGRPLCMTSVQQRSRSGAGGGRYTIPSRSNSLAICSAVTAGETALWLIVTYWMPSRSRCP